MQIIKSNVRNLYSTFSILILLYSCIFTQAQSAKTAGRDSVRLVVFDTIAFHLEQKNHIRLFYKQEWFENKFFRESIATLPIEDCLAIVKRLTDLNVIVPSTDNYVFVPVQVRNYSKQFDRRGILYIGDEREAGKIAKAVVTGRVIDAKTAKPLGNVSLHVDTLNVTVKTDKSGAYRLIIPTGEYILRLTYPGYEEDDRNIKVTDNGIVDFELSDRTIKLPEVIIRDKSIDENVIRSQMSLIRLNTRAIKELPNFLGEKDIIKSVTLLPGIQSTGEFGTGFFVRGGSMDQNLILVEDVPLFNSSHVFGLNSAINPDGVNCVTLLKAGIPARYGERASSVMDIRLASNAEKLQFKGGVGLLDSRLNIETPLFGRKVTLLFGGRTSYSDWLLHTMPDMDLKNSSAGFNDLNVLISVRFNPQNSLNVFGYQSNDNFRLVRTTAYQYHNTLLSVRYNHTFSEKLNSTLIAGYSGYRSIISESDSMKPKDTYSIAFSIKYYSGKLNFNWTPTPKHNFDLGFNSVLYVLQPGALSPAGPLSTILPQSSQNERGIELAEYVSDNISLSSRISAEAGIRVSQFAYLGANSIYVFKNNATHTVANIVDTLHYGKNEVIKWYSSLEPRLSFRYSMNRASSVKFNFNRISQYINLISNTAIMSPTDVYKLSSPNVKPLICNQFAVGYFRNFREDAIETSVEIYYKKLENIIEYRDGASIVLNKALEADILNASGNNYGVELYVRKNTGRLTGWLSYTYSRSMRKTTGIFDIDKINGNKYFSSSYDIPHNLVVNAGYHLSRRWRLALVYNYSTGKPITLPELKYTFDGRQYIYYSDRNKYRLPDYNRLDVAISFDETLRRKQKWKGSWTLSVLNVYGQKNPYSVFYKYNTQPDSPLYRSFNMYNLFIIERPIPTLTYNFSF